MHGCRDRSCPVKPALSSTIDSVLELAYDIGLDAREVPLGDRRAGGQGSATHAGLSSERHEQSAERL
jgi:hypothetical protein